MIYRTDGSFEGLLCAIFATYKEAPPSAIVSHSYQASLLDEVLDIATLPDIAERVVNGILRVGGRDAFKEIYRAFLSELPAAAMVLTRVVRQIMHYQSAAVLGNFANDDMLKLRNMVRIVNREVHRMHAFVRFIEANDGRFYALVEPDCDVMPLLSSHFQDRFADMPWVIYDGRRGYGLAYDLHECSFIDAIDEVIDPVTGQLDKRQFTGAEQAFQGLWQTYFEAVTIQSRKNIKHHIQQLPRRYWKYLSEKQFQKTAVPADFSLRQRKNSSLA